MKILILSDGKTGHENQSIAFAKLKNLDYEVVNINNNSKTLTYLLGFFGIYINLFNLHVKDNNFHAVVSAGSSTYYANIYLAKKLNIKSIAIMLPRGFRYKDFDYILANSHDNPPKRENLIELPINLSFSESKGILKREKLKSLGIIIGGSNSVFQMDVNIINNKLYEIFTNYPNHLKYLTTSRRTQKGVDAVLKKYNFDYKVIYSQDSSINPIPDFLEVCDHLFITIDSTSMLSEAKANSDAALHIIDLPSKKKNTKYHKLANSINKTPNRFDYSPYLEKVKL